MSKPEAIKKFRDRRNRMGFVYTSAYVPADRRDDFSTFVERMKGEHYIQVIATSEAGSEAMALIANSNIPSIPTVGEVDQFAGRFPGQKEVHRICAECIKEVRAANSSLAAFAMCEEDDKATYADKVKWRAVAVAHHTLAAALWRELTSAARRAAPTDRETTSV